MIIENKEERDVRGSMEDVSGEEPAPEDGGAGTPSETATGQDRLD